MEGNSDWCLHVKSVCCNMGENPHPRCTGIYLMKKTFPAEGVSLKGRSLQLHWDQNQGTPPAHQSLLSGQLSHGRLQHRLGSSHPLSRHQYPGHGIWARGTHHQGSSRDWAPSQWHEHRRGFLPEQVMEGHQHCLDVWTFKLYFDTCGN